MEKRGNSVILKESNVKEAAKRAREKGDKTTERAHTLFLTIMGFTSFAGRVLFSSIFIFAAWHKVTDFGIDGGGALKAMEPKVALFKNHVVSALAVELPDIETKYLLIAAIALEGIGGILFTFGSSLGAHLLLIFLASVTPLMHDFYNYDVASTDYAREFVQFLKNVSLFGALLFFLGMKRMAHKKSKKVKAKAN